MRRVYQQISQIAGNVITVQATGVGNQELASVEAPAFRSLAQVIRVEGDYVTLQVFAGTRGVPRKQGRTPSRGMIADVEKPSFLTIVALPSPCRGGLGLGPICALPRPA